MADQVEQWKRVAQARMTPSRGTAESSVEVRIAIGFAVVCSAAALGAGRGRALVLERMWRPSLLAVAAFAACACAAVLVRRSLELWDRRSGVSHLAEHAEARLVHGQLEDAAELARRGLGDARSARARVRLSTTLAWAAIGMHDPLLAHGAIALLPESAIDFRLIGAYLSCCNRLDEAEQLLAEARSRGHRDRETTKQLIDVLFRRGNGAGALALAREEEGSLSIDDWQAIKAAIPKRDPAPSN